MIEYHKNFSLESLPYINLEGLVCWEEFRDIPDYEGLYQVSDLGRVKTLNYRRINRHKILKGSLNSYGYLTLSLYKDEVSKSYKVHKLVAMAFLNHVPCGMELVVNHKNFIKTDNSGENLEIVTQRENANHKHLKSTSKYTGVYWDKSRHVWVSSLYVNGKLKLLGYFDDELEASQYYENALLAIQNGTEIQTKPNNFSSKYKGVVWDKRRDKWTVYIYLNGKLLYLGASKIEQEASQVYENALLDVKNGVDIKSKSDAFSSKYKSVTFDKSTNKWCARPTINKVQKTIGRFLTELEAHYAVENYKKQITE